ncbi:MAG: 2-oxoglutarate dehydrogenase E1 component [Gammaproteobacteria bacterium CG11_big_fil_rev_8_21_14_0_20_46_22]|nr:MAG: 2-oxoglutarate dehydrogenase E1 component [Gammaproteobacteria bacterium CG12_big_fil_rev_8_21_14_0_65_46_12]PIR11293.1 MAG: 2-oxoglutarate dehydrogenase E1 component [Gammaproteobacteria bacterium CG11_big_fil_rev_8_21_14_0_20_46_22]
MSALDFETERKNSYLEGDNITYLEGLYEDFLHNPESLSEEWRGYFEGLLADGKPKDVSMDSLRHTFKYYKPKPRASVAGGDVEKEIAVMHLIESYRAFGHLKAKLDPLGLQTPYEHPSLTLETHGLSSADLSKTFFAAHFVVGKESTLKSLIETLEAIYCGSVGVEYEHISNNDERYWLREQLEQSPQAFTADEQKRILKDLVAADGLEKYLALKYVGQKRFSLEGGDTLIPLLNQLLHDGARSTLDGVVIGMAHRGRLNVLVNILGKSSQHLFDEFEGKNIGSDKTGDVKYHMGYSSDVVVGGKPIHVALAFNPSHLEIVAPVVQGAVRAKQFRNKDTAREKHLAVMIHGDSAVAGQGVVFETINMSQLRGYGIGGSVHIVINNQVGFTTSDPRDTRSSHYCSDVAKTVDMPIFHVNGDDPEAACRVMKLAFAYQRQFKKDVMIDLVCYRRLGHNEADDPSITQPEMYAVVKKHPVTATVYAKHLVAKNIIASDDMKAMQTDYKAIMDQGGQTVKIDEQESTKQRTVNWSKYVNKSLRDTVETAVPKDTLVKLGQRITSVPEGFNVHPQVQKLLAERDEMTAGNIPMNWGYAETLAYASLVTETYHVRLSGEDSGRGTFAHRHAELHDAKTGEVYTPLCHVDDSQAEFEVFNSILSEEAVLAFEYGYAASDPKYLVLWEAQFGDFANGAQMVIDQFISSGEQKWDRVCALVMLLPHGYEGMGPEHSSARLERYLQLCAQHNMQVCVPTTPAQVFHMLRRQMLRPARKPLIVMTPKSLLRHKLAVSSLDDLSHGHFHLVIHEIDELKEKSVKRVIVCSGKVYYDLLQQRRDDKREDVAIVRIEQLYPFPRDELKAELMRYANAKTVVWCQEEPQNQGPWYQTHHNLTACLHEGQSLHYAGREASAAPAVGYAYKHKEEQAALVDQALNSNFNSKH